MAIDDIMGLCPKHSGWHCIHCKLGYLSFATAYANTNTHTHANTHTHTHTHMQTLTHADTQALKHTHTRTHTHTHRHTGTHTHSHTHKHTHTRNHIQYTQTWTFPHCIWLYCEFAFEPVVVLKVLCSTTPIPMKLGRCVKHK